MFRGWPAAPGMTVRAVELPGRQGRFREPPVDRMADLVDLLIAELTPEFDRPFALFGHSMGASIAFALTLELRRRGLPAPVHLLVSARAAPRATSQTRMLHRLPDAALLRAVRFGASANDAARDPELIALMLPTLRADVTLCETFVPSAKGAPLAIPVSAFGGLRDTGVGHAALSGWRTQTRGRFSLHRFPGDHHYPAVSAPALCATIAGLLAPASSDHHKERSTWAT